MAGPLSTMDVIGLRKPPEQPLSAPLQPGDSAPYLAVMEPDRPRYLVAFLRHVGCPFAEATVRQLRRLAGQYPEVQCILVSHGDGAVRARWLEKVGGAEGLTVVDDPERGLYGAFGVGYAGAGHFLGLRSLLGVVGLWFKGVRNRNASGTRWQKSATFLLDASRTVLWSHTAAHAADVPHLAPVLERFKGESSSMMTESDAAPRLRVRLLEHTPYEGIGNIERWLLQHDARIERTRFYADDWSLPDPETVDLIIVMGGPMSANDETALPWLKAEKAFLRDAVDRGVAVLGICLGAQVIASALGARVYAAPQAEIGWFDVQSVPATTGSIKLPSRLRVLHWHGETFELPPGAIRLASSEVCDNQAFQIGTRVIGLQFHLEVTPHSLASMLEHEADDLVPGPFVQGAEALQAGSGDDYRRGAKLMAEVLNYLTRARSTAADTAAGGSIQENNQV